MKKMLAMFVLAVLAILATPETAEAQYYGGYDPRVDQIRAAITGGYYGGYNQPYPSRGYFDQYRTDGRDIYGRKLPPIEVEECEYRECYGRKGTFHSEKGVMHFRMHDSTHNPFNMNHKNCIVIRSVEQVEEGSGPVRAESVQESAVATQLVEPTEIAEKKIVRNRFEKAPIRVYIGSRKVLDLPAGSADGEIEVNSSDRVWGEAYLENPKNGKEEWVPLQLGKGIDSLPEKSGWVFGNPDTRPSL